MPESPAFPTLTWTEADRVHTARWRSENGAAVPSQVVVAGDQTRADDALRIARSGGVLLWRGDFHSARLLLQAMGRRLDRAAGGRRGAVSEANGGAVTDLFHRNRQAQAQRSRLLSALTMVLEADYALDLRRAPDLRLACEEAYGAPDGQTSVVSLRELLGLVGAHEWRKKGVPIPAVGGRIHAHYGVFSPVRGEYIDLVAAADLPSRTLAFDIGTGTGVLACVLAQRGVQRIVATELDARALACAADNLQRLGFAGQVELTKADLFPPGRAPLVVCNPPWLPGKPSSSIEHAIYDPDSRMLRGFLRGLAAHLTPGGQGWLILSDLAEHLGLRRREELLEWIDHAGLRVLACPTILPRHPKAADVADALHAARSAEVTALWQLVVK
ncbi:class I SAM-dependent methyltransferase [Sphaerotilus sp.]|uniref:class I SAM-dependent methyltransferase n=1 Tax=Sphaerotilus sp. TaxID=2093942 RepID=UPI002ACE57B2|nr:class I SAM-dependent methyltransferase [Sphaerotilus sp.]MDZ7856032.1 class I SAM-dependent methyltransferase [Sphaerotilus sp.]